MKKIALIALLVVAMLLGYAVGIVRATRKAIREDRLGPALFAIAVAKAKEAKDEAKAEKVDKLRLRRAIEEVAALGDIKWRDVVLESVSDVEGYPQFMAVIADYVSKHPDVEISPSAQAYIARFKSRERPNKAPEPTPVPVTPRATESPPK